MYIHVHILRGADVTSDQHLVLTKLKLKLKKSWSPLNTRVKYVQCYCPKESRQAWAILNKSIKQGTKSCRTCSKMKTFPWMRNGTMSKKHWTLHVQEVLGKKMFQQKDWISVDTLNKVQERKKSGTSPEGQKNTSAKSKAQLQYTKYTSKKRTASDQSDKKNYIYSNSWQLKQKRPTVKVIWMRCTTKTLSGKQRQVTTPAKDKEGKVLTNTDDQLKR